MRKAGFEIYSVCSWNEIQERLEFKKRKSESISILFILDKSLSKSKQIQKTVFIIKLNN